MLLRVQIIGWACVLEDMRAAPLGVLLAGWSVYGLCDVPYLHFFGDPIVLEDTDYAPAWGAMGGVALL